MANSFLFFRGKMLLADSHLMQCWMYFLACEINQGQNKPDWLLDAEKSWNWYSRRMPIGKLTAELNYYIVDDERLQITVQLAQDTMAHLQSDGIEATADNLKDPNFGHNDLQDPKVYFRHGNPIKLCQLGMLFCELLLGTLHPAKARIMKGNCLFRVVPIIDYLVTLIPDGDVKGCGGAIMLGAGKDVSMDLDPHVYWYSVKNPMSQSNNDPKRAGVCRGMPDLAINVYPVPWLKEKITFELHELYNLQEHWYIDDEEHTVTVRRLVEGKLVVVDVLHAGEQFVSNILGGKVVQVDELLRTE
ncbi:MAG: hypothetical protein H0X30_27605 [Anaerolineae bacterium]|nr:hypothetical protein [Anaerolineae bacterium]